MAYCQGKFPEFLLDAWDEYDYRKDSDNDRPGLYLQWFTHAMFSCCKCGEMIASSADVFGSNQQYIAFLLENSGMQVGSYVVSSGRYPCWCGVNDQLSLQYHSFEEALSILRQVTISIAIAEEVSS